MKSKTRDITVRKVPYIWTLGSPDCDGDGGIKLKVWKDKKVFFEVLLHGGEITPKMVAVEIKKRQELYILRHYDGFDNTWIDIGKPMPLEIVQRDFNAKTNNGTRSISYSHIDYYKIFPADTKMLFS